MTENEVLKDLQNYQGILKAKARINASVNPEIALDAITEAIEVIQAYTANGTIEEFKALKEKSEQKKVTYQDGNEKCPACGSFHLFGGYCSECGQAVEYE